MLGLQDWHLDERQRGDCSSGYRYMVPYLGAYNKAQSFHIVMEYMAQSDLKHYMNIPWGGHNTRIVAKQLLSGLQFLHKAGLAHRDLKPLVGSVIMGVFMNKFSDLLMQNIFPILDHDKNLHIKIGDFSAAKIPTTDDPLKTVIGTWAYQAPEVLCGEPYDDAVDIWSLGCLFFRLWTGKPVFHSRKQLYTHAFCSPEKPPEAIGKGIKDKAAVELITEMLQIVPQNRPSAQHALSHAWFTNQPGLETQKVTQEVYAQFMKVLKGKPILQRLTVEPDEPLPNASSSGETTH